MESGVDIAVEFLKNGNYIALSIFALIAAILFLAKMLKQKDEFILKQYENLNDSISELQDKLQQLREAIMEVNICLRENKKIRGGSGND